MKDTWVTASDGMTPERLTTPLSDLSDLTLCISTPTPAYMTTPTLNF